MDCGIEIVLRHTGVIESWAIRCKECGGAFEPFLETGNSGMADSNKIEIGASDKTVQKYEALGKIIQENKEGLAKLEEEIPAEKRRSKGEDQ